MELIMIDNCGRSIDYLRISVTDRCNLRCVYCMPENGVFGMRHEEILNFEEITRLVRILASLGIKHLRITGGEPMVRRNCLDLVSRLHAVEGIESISMTSNGLLLCGRAGELKNAGISALNLSIDTLDPGRYSLLTRGGDLKKVLKTLHQALDAGLNVKVNTVLIRGLNDNDLVDLAGLAQKDPVSVRFIELMPIGQAKHLQTIPPDELLRLLSEKFGRGRVDDSLHGYGPARYIRYPGFAGSIGLISAVSHEFCSSCNRVRLTADGQLKLCLNHTKGLDLRAMLRSGASDNDILQAIQDAIEHKPERHGFLDTIDDREKRRMNTIGG